MNALHKRARRVRRAQRAELRRGPPWRLMDALLVLLVLLTGALAVWAPGILADIGDTVVGSTTPQPQIGISLSTLLLVISRCGLVLGILGILFSVRDAPLQQRAAWTVIAVALLMNYARNTYSGNPATLSFVLAHLGIAWLLWRLGNRPTVWAQMEECRERAERAEAEVKRLTGDT